jgi:hypothetical protein
MNGRIVEILSVLSVMIYAFVTAMFLITPILSLSFIAVHIRVQMRNIYDGQLIEQICCKNPLPEQYF